jgi:signal transduction histidine kinase
MTVSSQIAETPSGSHLPLPDRQFRRFLYVFHVVFIGGLVCSLLFRWRRTELNWTWVDTSLVFLAAVQATLYIRFFIVAAERTSAKGWGFYFGAAFALWFLEWRLEPDFEWAVGALLGQMFGVLRARISLPASVAVFATYFLFKFGWQGLAAFTAWEWVIGLGMIASWTALGLFIHKLVVTSAERARLISELEAARAQLEIARQRDAELAALRERERLARDLHDSLGHSLVTLSVQLEAIQRLFATNPARAAELLEEMKRLTSTSMEQLRRSLAGLRTPGLGDRPLRGCESAVLSASRRTDRHEGGFQHLRKSGHASACRC